MVKINTSVSTGSDKKIVARMKQMKWVYHPVLIALNFHQQFTYHQYFSLDVHYEYIHNNRTHI
uniref:Uncharacterized protein n=1 Tax=Timema genevievae TaxID=629358 RepID=A0A7R9PPK1_TIMGE|nr:unnamed protein product [Timema genevievae]